MPARRDQAKKDPAATEALLVERWKQGDQVAFNQIFETYYPRLLGFLTRMCGDPEDARESLQEVFLAVFRYLKDFRGESSLKNWVFRIAVTACLRKKRNPAGAGRAARQTTACSSPIPADRDLFFELEQQGGEKGNAWDPERAYLDKEFRRVVVQGVASMPPMYKIVLNLRDFEGFSTEEAAHMLGIKPATVKVRLHRARLYLQKWLRDHYPV